MDCRLRSASAVSADTSMLTHSGFTSFHQPVALAAAAGRWVDVPPPMPHTSEVVMTALLAGMPAKSKGRLRCTTYTRQARFVPVRSYRGFPSIVRDSPRRCFLRQAACPFTAHECRNEWTGLMASDQPSILSSNSSPMQVTVW